MIGSLQSTMGPNERWWFLVDGHDERDWSYGSRVRSLVRDVTQPYNDVSSFIHYAETRKISIDNMMAIAQASIERVSAGSKLYSLTNYWNTISDDGKRLVADHLVTLQVRRPSVKMTTRETDRMRKRHSQTYITYKRWHKIQAHIYATKRLDNRIGSTFCQATHIRSSFHPKIPVETTSLVLTGNFSRRSSPVHSPWCTPRILHNPVLLSVIRFAIADGKN